VIHLPAQFSTVRADFVMHLATKAPQAGESFLAYGFGLDAESAEESEKPAHQSDTLQYLTMIVLLDADCKAKYHSSGWNTASHFCGQPLQFFRDHETSGRGTAPGDNGGPAVRVHPDGSYELLGILTGGSKFITTIEFPQPYARVDSAWIVTAIGN